MKKLLTMICMITCILGLTACGQKAEISERDQMKLDYAIQSVAPQAVSVITSLMDDTSIAELQQYTAEEIAYQMGNSFNMNVEGNAFVNALASFRSGSREIGGIQSIGETTAVIDDKQIIVTVGIKGNSKDANAEMIFSNDMFMTMESAALNPVYTVGDIVGKAGLNTLIGMGIVFTVLILISAIISLFGFIPKLQQRFAKKESSEEIRAEGIDKGVSQIIEQEEIFAEADDTELIAVIAAAIAASEGAVTTEGFVVRSIRRRNRSRY